MCQRAGSLGCGSTDLNPCQVFGQSPSTVLGSLMPLQKSGCEVRQPWRCSEQHLPLGECYMRVSDVDVIITNRQVTSALSHSVLLCEMGTLMHRRV